jgi:uncharacterized repeat protein (TIGR03803 family)
MALAPNGKFYGTTYGGGNTGGGLIYSYNPLTNLYNNLVNFNLSTMVPVNSSSPLVMAPNGLFYSILNGGANSKIYSFNYINQIISTVYSFSSVNPSGAIVLASNNKFYGSAFYNSSSLLYEFDYSSNSYMGKVSFTPLTGYATSYVTEVNSVGLKNVIGDSNTFKLNPNPVNDIFNLQFNSPLLSDVNLEIINTMGVKLFQQNILRGNNNSEINIANLTAGVYYIKLYANGGIETKKIIKL